MARLRSLAPAFAAAALVLPASAAAAHGDLISSKPLHRGLVLRSAARNAYVLYRSVSPAGGAIEVSGSVSIPRGKPPKGGWPVVSWAHGTTGIGDQCTPTRLLIGSTPTEQMLNSWVKAGYAVAATDYEGLGTPGPHPYLEGVSEGRGVLDIVRAARKLDPQVGKRLVIAGHSQGGQAALWAASLAPRWTPELRLMGTEAFAPPSAIRTQFELARNLTQPGPRTGFGAMILRGLDIENPGLHAASLLGDRALALWPKIDDECGGQILASDNFGGLPPSDLFKQDADLTGVLNALTHQVDPNGLRIRGRIAILQGTADQLVLKGFTDQLVSDLGKLGDRIDYMTYEGADHGGVITAGGTDATAFLKRVLP